MPSKNKKLVEPPAKKKKTPDYAWSPKFRAIISVALLFHCLAVFVAPLASPYPSSELSRTVESWMEPYLRATFLKDHGYRFFAPNPPMASHLVRYELIDKDGTITGEGRFPNLDEHWPRLLYHRHFMISESLYGITDMPAEPPSNHPEAIKDFQRGRQLADTYLESIGSHLSRQHNAPRVKLYMVEHFILSPEESLAGKPADDADLFQERLLGEYISDEVTTK